MPPAEAPRTLGGILDASSAFLAARKAPEPRLAAEWLAARLLKCRRLDLHLKYRDLLPDALVDAMRRGVKRVAAGEPVQYVVGRWEFRGHPLIADRRALIPRPETEQLVQLVLDDRALWQSPTPRIVDIGTGSGCIAVSLAKERPQGRYLATDVSPDALALAKENAVLNGVGDRIAFAPGELSDLLDPATVDAIVSNPPYIPSAVVDGLAPTVRDFEPRVALDGGEDGMDILRQIAEEATLALRNGGGLFFELSAEQRQAEAMGKYLQELGFENIATHSDLAGAARFVSATLAAGL
jgi:release factor glutamine methyltransferase